MPLSEPGARSRAWYLLYAVGLGLLAALIWRYEPRLILQHLRSVRVGWFASAVAALLAVGVLGAFNAFMLVGRDRSLPFRKFLPAYWASWAIGLVVPGQVGDIASIGLLLRRHALALSLVWGRAGVDKVVSLLVALSFAIFGLAMFMAEQATALYWLVVIAGLLFVATLAVFVTESWWRSIFDPDQRGWRGAIGRMLREFIDTVRHSPVRVLANLALTLVKFALTGFAYWAVFRSLGANEAGLLQTVILSATAGLVAYLPLSVNGLGTVEAAGVVLFGKIGVAAATVVSAYIVLRVIILSITWGPTLVWWAFTTDKTQSS